MKKGTEKKGRRKEKNNIFLLGTKEIPLMRQFSDIHKHSWVFLVFDTYLKMVLVSQKLSPKRFGKCADPLKFG